MVTRFDLRTTSEMESARQHRLARERRSAARAARLGRCRRRAIQIGRRLVPFLHREFRGLSYCLGVGSVVFGLYLIYAPMALIVTGLVILGLTGPRPSKKE